MWESKSAVLQIMAREARHFSYSSDEGRDDCGGTGPDVGCDGVCYSAYEVDTCGECVESVIDTDGDSVPDSCDSCPVDANDSDGDGICDSDDEYPNCSATFMTVQMCAVEIYVDECGACNADSSDDFVCLDITGLNATGGLNGVLAGLIQV